MIDLTPQFTPEELQRATTETLERELKALTRDLQYIGEQVVTEARIGEKKHGKDYLTQTGNLRSSIGYAIALDGTIILESDFTPVAGSEDGTKGAEEGRAFAREEAKKHQEGLVLVVVAGTNYATYLHNRGYDVLDSAELIAREMIDRLRSEYKILG